MKLKSFLLLSFTLFLIYACSKTDSAAPDSQQQEEETPNPDANEEETGPITYFTLISERPKAENIIDEWIVIHDEQGQLLDFSQFDVGDNLVFESETEVSEVISVTEVLSIQYDYGKTFTITTTTGVQNGSIWTLDGNPAPDDFYQLNSTGEFTVDVSAIPELVKVTTTNTKTHLGGSTSTTTYPGSPPSTDMSLGIPLYEGENDYYITILDGLSQYKYYDFTYEGVDISLDYTEFKDFDSYHTINFPEHNFYIFNVAGFKEEYPYSEQRGVVLQDIISFHYPDIPTQPFIYGYLNEFDRYRTVLAFNYKNLHYFCVQYGPRLEQIEIPDPAFNITNLVLSNFRFEVDIDYVSASHSWRYSEGASADNNLYQTLWYVKAGKGFEPIVGVLPAEILEKHSEMNTDDLEYEDTTLNLPLASEEFNSRSSITIKKE